MEIVRHDGAGGYLGNLLQSLRTGQALAGQVAIDRRVIDADRLGERQNGYIVGVQVTAELHAANLFAYPAENARRHCEKVHSSPYWRIMGTTSKDLSYPNRVRETRERLGLTLQQIAEKSGITVQMLSRLERGERVLNDHSLTLIATALGVRKSVLINTIEGHGSAPLALDVVDDKLELALLHFWRSLPLERQYAVFSQVNRWANADTPAAVNE
jgi:transcriptional regulator with XRE-family HTH domain